MRIGFGFALTLARRLGAAAVVVADAVLLLEDGSPFLPEAGGTFLME